MCQNCVLGRCVHVVFNPNATSPFFILFHFILEVGLCGKFGCIRVRSLDVGFFVTQL